MMFLAETEHALASFNAKDSLQRRQLRTPRHLPLLDDLIGAGEYRDPLWERRAGTVELRIHKLWRYIAKWPIERVATIAVTEEWQPNDCVTANVAWRMNRKQHEVPGPLQKLTPGQRNVGPLGRMVRSPPPRNARPQGA